MAGRFEISCADHALLPGKPADYIGTEVLAADLSALLQDPDIIASIIDDAAPLPTTEAREGHYGPRHLEFWLSGLRDARKLMAVAGLSRGSAPVILDFACASGRVARHFGREMPKAEILLCDKDRNHVALVKTALGDRITAFPIIGGAHLPLPDKSVDIITAFSVFTRFRDDDITWLLEFRRILRPGGLVYATIHDAGTWRNLPQLGPLAELSFSNADFKKYYDAHPELNERVVHFYSDANNDDCNAFHPERYIRDQWGQLFDIVLISPAAHDHQGAVLLRKR